MTQHINETHGDEAPFPPEALPPVGGESELASGRDQPRHTDGAAHIETCAEDKAETSAALLAGVHELEAQGFSTEEAVRLMNTSERAATSEEVREAEAVLRRLRFQRWLIEHGLLDEFSV